MAAPQTAAHPTASSPTFDVSAPSTAGHTPLDDLALSSTPSLAAQGSSAAEDGVRQESTTSSFYRAANDDFIEVNEHLKYLKRQGDRAPETLALVITVSVALVAGLVLLNSDKTDLPSSPKLLVATFVCGSILFLLLSTLLRQRMTLTTLSTLLRTTAHLTQPDNAERQRMALIPERFRADVASLDRSVSRVGDRANKVISSMNIELDAFAKQLADSQLESKNTLENISIERAAIVTNSENLRHTLNRVSSDTSKELALVATNLQTLFQAKSAGLIEVIDERNRKFISEYLAAEEKTLSSMRQLFDQALAKATSKHEANNNRLLQQIIKKREEQDEKLGHQIRDSTAAIDHQIARLWVKVDEILQGVSRKAEDILERTQEATGKKAASMKTILAETIVDLSHAFRESNANLEVNIENLRDVTVINGKLEEKFASQINDFKSAVIEPLEHLTGAFGEKSRQVASEVSFQITSFNEAATSAGSEIEALFVAEARRMEKTTKASVSVVRSAVEGLEAECTAAVDRFSRSIATSASILHKTSLSPIERQGVVSTQGQTLKADDTSREKQPVTDVLEQMAPLLLESKPSSVGQSWISQLLARADEAGALDNKVNTKSKSFEGIARILSQIDMLIKPKELATAWNLFKETNSADFSGAFTREGRSSIRLIKMKLDEDDDLSAYIQRYLAKVEDLLREAYASNDENALHAYMVSPSGKVYTLLAYASERI